MSSGTAVSMFCGAPRCQYANGAKVLNSIPMQRLEGRTAIVTGGGQGIGEAIALAMAEEGASVVVAELREETADAVQRKIEEGGGTALAHATDVSREDSVEAMVRACLDRFGKVDILVNNAGIYPTNTVAEMPEDEWERVIGTNLFGTFLCSRAVVPQMLEQRSGRIISITSGRGPSGGRQRRPLRGLQGRHHRLYQEPRAGTGALGHRRQLHLPGCVGHRSTEGPQDRRGALRQRGQDPAGAYRPAAGHGQGGGVPRQRPGEVRHRTDRGGQRRSDHAIAPPDGAAGACGL